MLFDIAQADALIKIQISGNRFFLEDQRSVRRMFIGEDKIFTAKQKRIKQRKMKEKEQRQKATESLTFQTVHYSTSNSSFDSNDEAPVDYRPSTSTCASEKVRANAVENADAASALDRNKTSDREAVRLLIPVAAPLGHDPTKFPLPEVLFRGHERELGKI